MWPCVRCKQFNDDSYMQCANCRTPRATWHPLGLSDDNRPPSDPAEAMYRVRIARPVRFTIDYLTMSVVSTFLAIIAGVVLWYGVHLLKDCDREVKQFQAECTNAAANPVGAPCYQAGALIQVHEEEDWNRMDMNNNKFLWVTVDHDHTFTPRLPDSTENSAELYGPGDALVWHGTLIRAYVRNRTIDLGTGPGHQRKALVWTIALSITVLIASTIGFIYAVYQHKTKPLKL